MPVEVWLASSQYRDREREELNIPMLEIDQLDVNHLFLVLIVALQDFPLVSIKVVFAVSILYEDCFEAQCFCRDPWALHLEDRSTVRIDRMTGVIVFVC